jgi:hypothetical protein
MSEKPIIFEDISLGTLEPRLQKYIREDVLVKYVEYLNRNRIHDWETHYTVGHFTDTDVNRYAETHVVFIREVPSILSPSTILHLYVSDGDDGGGAQLFVIAERIWSYTVKDGYHFKDEYQTKNIIQSFDTLYTTVFELDLVNQ